MKRAALLLFFMGGLITVHSQSICNKVNGDKYHYPSGDTTWSEYFYCIAYSDTTWNESPMSAIPEFSGDFNKWLEDNITYPVKALDALIQGRVVITFNVEKDGSVSTIQLLTHDNIYLDTMAVNAVSRMPKWKPGIRNNQGVKTTMVLYLRFRIKDWQSHYIYGPGRPSSKLINEIADTVY